MVWLGRSAEANSEDHFCWRHDARSITAFPPSLTYSTLCEYKPAVKFSF